MANIRELSLDDMDKVFGGKNETGMVKKPDSSSVPSGWKVYQIKSGDTLKKIAESRGVTTADLLGMNPFISNPSLINVGYWLYVPDNSSSADNGGHR